MSDDRSALKILIVSDAGPERELLRQAAAAASAPIEVAELEAIGDPKATGELLARGGFDVVFFDSRPSKPARQSMLDAIRATPSRPLAVLIGPSAIKTREVLTEGLDVDSTLAKPIDKQEARNLLDLCIRSQLPKRILIVDDSSTVRSVIRKVLQASRFKLEVDDAGDGTAAIAQVKKQRFDIAFLDCQMPVIDGFAILAEFKRTQPDLKVVMITGTRDVRIEERARVGGAEDFLYKPFFAKDIDAALNRLFGLVGPRWD